MCQSRLTFMLDSFLDLYYDVIGLAKANHNATNLAFNYITKEKQDEKITTFYTGSIYSERISCL